LKSKIPLNLPFIPDYYFPSPGFQKAQEILTYGVKERKGFLAVIGARGAGKTTLIRTWVKGLDPGTHKVIPLYNPPVSFERLLSALAPAFGLAVEDAGEPAGLVKPLYQALTREHDQGKNVVLAVDEAQELNEETLENLRLVSNLETPSEKIIQIILVGEPLLWEKLSRHGLRQLKTRITMKINLPPFNPQESREYIRLRLEEEGGRIEPLFSRGALKTIIHQARGNPGRINFLCSQALRIGEDPHSKPLSKKTVNEVIRKLEGGQSASWPRWAVPALAVIAAAVGLSILGQYALLWGPEQEVSLPIITRPGASRPLGQEKKRESPPPVPPLPAGTIPEEKIRQPDASSIPGSVPREKMLSEKKKAQGKERKIGSKKKRPRGVSRIVKKGDNFYRLVFGVYGSYDSALRDNVLKANPWIKDINRIPVEKKIFFPSRKRGDKPGR
jgi:general secretion pathway protein A